ncbi:MAG: DUF1592 domain-containing protein [Acidobacteria bacterium]|nr:DUF1592 domain-containing protein [Acidobacteriota bacterium]
MLVHVPRCALLLLAAPLLAQPDRAAFVQQYCATCHSQSSKSGGLILEGVPSADPSARPEIWEKAARKVRAGEMPPAGAPRPDKATAVAFARHLTADLDAAARRQPYQGKTVIRRLNRTEYANAIRDLLAIDLPLAAELPPDGLAAGFDNIADALAMSPLLLERYLKTARRVSELAVGIADPSPVTEVYPATRTQAVWQGEGMPFGTRGGIRVNHYFSHDGDYDLRAFLAKESLTPLEGVRFFRARVRVKAGAHSVVAAFPDEYAEREGPVLDVAGPGGAALGGPLDLLGTAVRPKIEFRIDGRRVKLFEIRGMTSGEAAFDGQPGPPTLARIEIAGPYNAAGAPDAPSRKRIFVCTPAAAGEETACAKRILTALARRAFRRPVTEADLRPYLATYSIARSKGSFDAAVAAALRDLLLAPDFLFRLELDPDAARATRLSFFLWSSIPDDALLDAAAGGRLRGEGLAAEVRRMLADSRSAALLDNFASQWLGLGALRSAEPDKMLFPEFDAGLAAAFETETRLFVGSVIRENRSVLDLVGAGYTFLDERLARHYGIPGVMGPGFRRVALEGEPARQRGGLLTHGSILVLTSHTTKTSPVLRGKWILDNLLNSPPPPPPANVPALDESPAQGRKATAREMVERHRANPACAGCHARIDPLGFALENFDAIGRWRTRDGDAPIDSSGTLPGGAAFTGPAGLKQVLLDRGDEFVHAAVERLLTYALGRELDPRDQPTVREIMRKTEAGRYRFQDLVTAIVECL